MASSTDLRTKRLVRSNQRQVPYNQQLCRLSGRRGSLEKALFLQSEPLGVLEEVLVREVEQLFLENQTLDLEAKLLDLEAKTLCLVAKVLVREVGRTSLESKRLRLENKRP